MRVSNKKFFLLNVSGVDENNISLFNFIHTTNIWKKKFSSQNLALAIIPTSNNSQTNVRNVLKICFQAMNEGNVNFIHTTNI